MSRISHLLQTHDGYGDVGGIRPIAIVFADPSAVDNLYASFWDTAPDLWLRSPLNEHVVEHGFYPTDWEAALLIEAELEQHYGPVARRYFTDWNERAVDMETSQPTDKDQLREENAERHSCGYDQDYHYTRTDDDRR